ncbi:MAG: hypothetical protein P1V97_16690, partial [Planctomycetota bacterium]|nr:hypothetical protein [Planctomycetota bacterium]
ARVMAFRLTGNPRFASKAVDAPEAYLRILSQHYDAHKDLTAVKYKDMGKTIGVQLELIAKFLDLSNFDKAKRERIIGRLREDLEKVSGVEDLWLSRLRNAVFNHRFNRARDLGELLLTFFPKSANSRRVYEDTMIKRALTLHRSFERTRPRMIMDRALKHLDSSRLHVYFASFHERRNFPKPEMALNHFNRAVELGDKDKAFALGQRAYYNYRRTSRLARKNRQKALECLAQATKDVEAALIIEPDSPLAFAVAGLLNVMQGKNARALDCFNKALVKGPESIEDSFDLAYLALYNRGQLLIQMGKGRVGYDQILAARRLIEPNANQIGDDFKLAKLIARSDKALAKTILRRLLVKVVPKERSIVEKMIKELGN